MSDEDVADSWMDLVDKEIDELPVQKNDKFADEEKILEGTAVITKPIESANTSSPSKNEDKESKNNKGAKEELGVSKPIEKPRALTAEEKRKAELLSRLNEEKAIEDLFSGISPANQQFSAAEIILRKDEDFVKFAKTISERFEEDTESVLLEDFAIEVLISQYKLMKPKELDAVWQKLKMLKVEKKKDDKEKEKEKKKRKEAKKETKKEQEKKEEKSEKPSSRMMAQMDDFM